MKFLKRLILLLVVLAVILVAAGWRFTTSKPGWYVRRMIDPAAAQRAEEKVLQTMNWASQTLAAETRAGATGQTQPAGASDNNADAHPISFTDTELNAFFDKWDKLNSWDEKYSTYITEPAIGLEDGELIFAGTSRQFGTVISLHFTPRLDAQGNLRLDLSGVRNGQLPMPESVYSKYVTQLERKLAAALPDLQRKAKIDANGSTNRSAISAAMAKMALRALHREPTDPVLFLPAGSVTFPVRITDVRIADQSLDLKVRPLSRAERDALLQRIREPYSTAAAARADSAPPTF